MKRKVKYEISKPDTRGLENKLLEQLDVDPEIEFKPAQQDISRKEMRGQLYEALPKTRDHATRVWNKVRPKARGR